MTESIVVTGVALIFLLLGQGLWASTYVLLCGFGAIHSDDYAFMGGLWFMIYFVRIILRGTETTGGK